MPDFGDVDPVTGRTSARTQWDGTADPLAVGLSPEAYAEYSRRRRKAAILGVLSVLGVTTGLGALGGALSGAGAAGAASASGGAAGSAGAGAAGAGGSIGTIAGGAPWAVTPYAGTAAMSAPGAIGAGLGAGGAAAGGGAGAFAGMSAQDLAGLAAGTASAVGPALTGGNRQDFAPNTQTTDPNLVRLMQTMQGRLDQSEPLYKSIMAMANGLLPTQYQNGGAGRG